HGRYRPASTIKMLLALVALDELDLDTEITATAEDADAEGSAVGIGKGGKYTNRQLMQGLVMASGNDAAHALARQLGGDAA
ncbi:serine hydrolase, partial [Rhodococcus erythropolis]|nr:serine hydrolase [Rhodococcus erythropolis]